MSTTEPLPPFPEDGARNDSRPAAAIEPPPSLGIAVTLMRVGAGLAGLQLIVTLATLGAMKDDLIDELHKTSPDLTSSQLDSAYTASIILTTVVSLVSIALWLWMASANGKGRRWARTVATALGGVNIVFLLTALTSGTAGGLALVFAVLNLLVGAGALWFLYKFDSREFFTASRPIS